MRRWIRITLLALGTVLGYGFAIHSMRHHHDGYGHDAWCERGAWDRSWQRVPPKPETPAPQEPPTPR